ILVNRLEQAVIDVLAELDINSARQDGKPGVYVGPAKIASIGLKVSRGCTYHGLAFNIDMDLSPFSLINPCGFSGLAMTQVGDHAPRADWDDLARRLTTAFCELMGYHAVTGEPPALGPPQTSAA